MQVADRPAGAAGGAAGWTLLAVLAVWAIFLLPSLAALFLYGDAAGTLDQDDAMRLVQVRDLLGGQGWFDNVQHRLGPDGTAMHWSRLVDAPIAGLILLLRPALGAAAAEAAVVVVWPLLLALVPLAVAVATLRSLEGRMAAVLGGVLMAQMLIHTRAFAPTALDHHNVQVALLLLAVGLGMIGLARPGAAAGAGAAVAASLAVGIETLPHLAAICAFVALHWAVRGAPARAATTAFAAGLGLATALLFVAAAPAEAWRGGFCDALSIDQAAPLLTGAGGLALAARGLSGRTAALRLAALAGVAGAVAAVTLLWTPACLSSPLDAFDPRLRALWFDRVAETQPLFASLATTGPYLIPLIVVWTLGFGTSLALAAAGRARAAWLLVALVLLACLGMTLWQNRGAVLVGPVAALPLGAAIGRLYGRGVATGRGALRLAALGVFALATPQVWTLAVTQAGPAADAPAAPEGSAAVAARAGDPQACLEPSAYDTLAALPAGLVSGSSNLGAFVLLHTPHRALSAPYHRNQAGLLAEIAIGYGSDAEAEAALRAQGADYVIACPADPEYGAADGADLGFGFRLAQGRAPDFLEPVPGAGPVQVYRLRPTD